MKFSFILLRTENPGYEMKKDCLKHSIIVEPYVIGIKQTKLFINGENFTQNNVCWCKGMGGEGVVDPYLPKRGIRVY